MEKASFSSTISKDVSLQYLVYLPPNYEQQKQKKGWPLMLFLHGAGERGKKLKKVRKHGPLSLVKEGYEFPFIIVAPQCPKNTWWEADSLLALLDHITETYRVNQRRIYLTGLSMGGFGTWMLAAAAPDRFAAIAPICGPAVFFSPGTVETLPAWCFHGAMDPIVSISESVRMVGRIRDSGGDIRFTVYPDAGHDSWTETYTNPELYRWLLQHKRPKS